MKKSKASRRKWLRRCRVCFRWCRITGWAALFVGICLAIYLSEVGLPGWAKDRIVAAAREQGVRLSFGAMRLHWLQGITVDNAVVEADGFPGSFKAERIILDLDQGRLWSGGLRLHSLGLRTADLTLTPGAKDLDPILVHGIACRVSFPATNVVTLDHLEGRWRTGVLSMQLALTNPAAMTRRMGTQPPLLSEHRSLTNQVDRIALALTKLGLNGVPSLRINLSGDLADPMGVVAVFSLTVPEAATPWGTVTNLSLEVRNDDQASTGHPEAVSIMLRTDGAATPWGQADGVEAQIEANPVDENALEWSATFHSSLATPSSEWVAAAGLEAEGRALLKVGKTWPVSFDADLRVDRPMSAWAAASAASIRVSRTEETNAWTGGLEPGSLSFWTNLVSHRLAMDLDATNLVVRNVAVPSLGISLLWNGPRLTVSRCTASFPSGDLAAHGELDVAKHVATGSVISGFDPASVRELLPASVQNGLEGFKWSAPPTLTVDAKFRLPRGSDPDGSWTDRLRRDLELSGSVDASGLAFRGVAFDRVSGSFSHSNGVWQVHGGRLTGPDGAVTVDGTSDQDGAHQSIRLLSTIRPEAFAPWMGEHAEKVFEMVSFPKAPLIEGTAELYSSDPKRSTFKGRVATTNVLVREVDTGEVAAGVSVEWPWVRFENVRIERGTQWLASPLLSFNLDDQMLSISNGTAHAEVEPVGRIIGPRTWSMLSAYEFLEPPYVEISGVTPVHEEDRPKADLRFRVKAERFRWKYFNIGQLTGDIRWTGNGLELTNLAALAYEGTVGGSATFAFQDNGDVDFRFRTAIDDMNLKTVLNDLGVTNRVEGRITGNLNITDGSSYRPTGWNGYGHADLTNGFLWDYPLFAFLSPIVDTVAPGTGRDAARSARGDFYITNNVIFSDNLTIRAAALRLNYHGSVGFDHRLNAHVDATILRDTWFVGPLLSLALTPFSKVFEYRVGGTLSDPVMEPVYVPNFLMKVVAPFNSTPAAPKPVAKPETPPPTNPKVDADPPAP